VVFDKGRVIGGRLATRRTGDLQFDHGAQYVNAHGERFAAVLHDLAAMGAAAPWQDGSGRSHTVGTPGMSALVKALGAGLDIRQNAQVLRIVQGDVGWRLRIGNAELAAERLVITVPAPQVPALLGADHPLVPKLARVGMAPCLTLMAGIRGPAPFVTRSDPDDPLAWIAQDSAKPGRRSGDVVAWVAQAGTAFSTAHLEKDPAESVALMLPMLVDRLGTTPDQVTHAAAHRWRYARVTAPLGQPFLRSADARLHLGGDWCLGPRVEAAWTSGIAIAEDLLAHL
jgi:predicted NAD/FAD-dependent oxidoreductase